MKKRDYFLYALQNDYYRHKRWVMSCFSVTASRKDNDPYEVYHQEKQTFVFINNEKVILDDAISHESLFSFKDSLTIKQGELANVVEDVNTTYGIALINAMVIIYSFGNKVPYINGEIKAGALEKYIEERLIDNPKEGQEDPSKIYVSEYKKFVDAMFSLVGYSQLCVPTTTEKSLMTDPRIPEVRKQLLEKYKDKLNDPATIAEIEKVLIQMDKDWLKGDPAEGFLIADKHYSIVRKKLYLMHGIEKGFKDDGEIEVIEGSLNEGWDITKLPSMVNSQREGTFNRGAQTALGGEAAKFLGRVFQNAVIAEDDCGSTLGWERLITQRNKGDFEGLYRIVNNGIENLTKESLEGFVGKTITVRSPMFCKTSGASFCAKCMGDKISISPTSLTMHAISVGSQIMYAMMKSMHGKKLETEEFTIDLIR